jgi:hypothetical protein
MMQTPNKKKEVDDAHVTCLLGRAAACLGFNKTPPKRRSFKKKLHVNSWIFANSDFFLLGVFVTEGLH